MLQRRVVQFFLNIFQPIYKLIFFHLEANMAVNFVKLKLFLLSAATLPAYLQSFDCPPVAGTAGAAYDYFRSIPEGDWEGNTGALVDFNLGTPLLRSGWGFQFGSSYGIYDWTGRNSAPSNLQKSVQQQLFLTAGLFRKTPCCSGINAGIVFDWMWNKRLGVFGVETSFSQLRVQGGYLCEGTNEYGIWSAIPLEKSHRSSQHTPLTFRAISQINAYWKHTYANCAETMLWIGAPYMKSLSFHSGKAGKIIVGASFHAPLCRQLQICGHANYMAPHSASENHRGRYHAANICLGVQYSFGSTCSKYTPYMPVGNNSNFMTDTNLTF